MSATAEMAHFRAGTIADVIRRVWPRHAAKQIARATGTPVGTAKRWAAGETEPRASDLIRLMAECEDVAAEVNRLVAEARACYR